MKPANHLSPNRIFLSPVIILFVLLITSCTKNSPAEELDGDHEIITFELKTADGNKIDASKLTVTIKTDSILIVVPAGTDLTKLTPIITISGVTISPASGVQQNFTGPVTYTVTAEDGSTRKYVVVIKAAPAMSGVGDLVFFGSGDNSFYALNTKTGALKWKFASTASFAYSSPTYKDGILYIGGIDNYVYAFDANTGVVIWRKQIAVTGIESDAVISGNTVYVGTNDDELYALDAKTGNTKWKFLTGGNISASPTFYGKNVYFGSSDGGLYALDTATGTKLWRFATGAMINQSGPSLVDGIIYVGSRDQNLYAIDAVTGNMKWKYTTTVSLEMSSPTVANGIVYIGGWYDISNFSIKGSLYAVDAATGQLKWESLKNTGIGSCPYVSNGILYISSDGGNFNALNAITGDILWQKQILPNGASATAADGIVYVGGGGTRYFYAFDATNGTEKWKFSIPNGLMTSSPLIVDDAGAPHHPGDSGAQW